jgi:Acyl-protein synthetase, LuxE
MNQAQQARASLRQRVEAVTPETFEDLALDVFRFQSKYNVLYHRYLSLLRVDSSAIRSRAEIPHLPIQLFKSHQVKTGRWLRQTTFTSSGTTGMQTSRHAVRDVDWYLRNATRGFEMLYGALDQYAFLALLPSYLERKGSSLVMMAEHFIRHAHAAPAHSGFFLHDHQALVRALAANQAAGVKTVLLGVTYALLDLTDHPALRKAITHPDLLMVMETGGMKGKRREMTREEVHQHLKTAFGVSQIHSEYGMTELLSQAYAPKNGLFMPAPTMAVQCTEANDPFTAARWLKGNPLGTTQTGVLNITDLANLDTCAFIATEDMGRVVAGSGHFEVLGRLDIAEMRGCNLMVE